MVVSLNCAARPAILLMFLSLQFANYEVHAQDQCLAFSQESQKYDCGEGLWANEEDDLDGEIEIQRRVVAADNATATQASADTHLEFRFLTSAKLTRYAFSTVEMPEYGYRFLVPIPSISISPPTEERPWMEDASDLNISWSPQDGYSFFFDNVYQGKTWEWLTMNPNAHIPILPEYVGHCEDKSLFFKMRGAANLGGRLPEDPHYNPGLNEAVKAVLQLSERANGDLNFHLRYYTRYAGNPEASTLNKIRGHLSSFFINMFKGVDVICKKR